MPTRPIFFSVAHSTASPGCYNKDVDVDEHSISMRATLAAFGALAGEFPCQLYDCGAWKTPAYAELKIAAANGSKALLALELHCNSSDTHPSASYSEVLHHRLSTPGAEAAAVIARTIGEGFAEGRHLAWRSKGARPNSIEADQHYDFFIEKTSVPAIIVEGLFLSNDEQAAWAKAPGGAEAYGLLVAEGIKRWLGGARG